MMSTIRPTTAPSKVTSMMKIRMATMLSKILRYTANELIFAKRSPSLCKPYRIGVVPSRSPAAARGGGRLAQWATVRMRRCAGTLKL